MKDCRYGLYMGALFLPLIVLSQAVFPSTRSVDEVRPLILGVYLATFLYYGAAGFWGARRCHSGDGIRIGALTALVGMGLVIAIFSRAGQLLVRSS